MASETGVPSAREASAGAEAEVVVVGGELGAGWSGTTVWYGDGSWDTADGSETADSRARVARWPGVRSSADVYASSEGGSALPELAATPTAKWDSFPLVFVFASSGEWPTGLASDRTLSKLTGAATGTASGAAPSTRGDDDGSDPSRWSIGSIPCGDVVETA